MTNATEDFVPQFGDKSWRTLLKPMRRSMKLFTGAHQRTVEQRESFPGLQVMKTERLVERA